MQAAGDADTDTGAAAASRRPSEAEKAAAVDALTRWLAYHTVKAPGRKAGREAKLVAVAPGRELSWD